MDEPEQILKRRRGKWGSLTVAAVSGASALALVLPSAVSHAEPVPAPPPAPTAEAPPPADPNAPPPPPPADPNAPPPAPADPNAPPPPPPADPNAPPADPNAPVDPEAPAPPAPEPGRVDNAAGGFSFVLPAGWVEGDASRLNYGSALLVKDSANAAPDQPAAVAATDTSILLGRLDLKLFAGAEPDNAKAATRLASDMGEFFMPFAGTRVNQESFPLDANGMPGSAAYYEVNFTDTTKPSGQIWAGVVGTQAVNAPRGQRNERWFMVWLGTSDNPVDKDAAAALANSIRPWAPPPPPPPPPPADPNAAPPPADPNAPPPDPDAPQPAQRNQVGVPVPVTTPVPEMTPPA